MVLQFVYLTDDGTNLSDCIDCCTNVGLNGVDSRADIFGRLGGLFRQLLNLSCNNRKSFTRFTGTSGLNGLRSGRRKFVCSAIEVISLITLPISALESPSRATVVVAVSAASTAAVAILAASWEFSSDFLNTCGHLRRRCVTVCKLWSMDAAEEDARDASPLVTSQSCSGPAPV